MASNIDAMLEFNDMPCVMETLSGRVVATTTHEMRIICESFVRSLQLRCLSHFMRQCLDAKFKGPDTIWVTYETRFLRNGAEITGETYMSFTILTKRSEGWRFSNIQLLAAEDGPVSSTLKGG